MSLLQDELRPQPYCRQDAHTCIVFETTQVDIGELCLKYGGGGHRNAGTCQLENDEVDAKLPDIIAALNQ